MGKNAMIWIKGVISFSIFFVTSQFFTFLIPFPFRIKGRVKATIYTRLLRFYASFVNHTHLNISFQHVNRKNDLFKKASLVVCNHQSILDVPIAVAFSSKMCVINNNWHNNPWAKFFILKYIRFFPIDLGKDLLVEALRPSVENNCPVLIFPEGVMNKNKMGRFHKGGFYVAYQLKIDVQPVVIHYSDNVFTRKWFYMKNGKATIKYLDTIKAGSPEYGNSYQELTKNVNDLMRREYHEMAASL